MSRKAFSRPKRSEVRGKAAKRKMRNRFAQFFLGIGFLKKLSSLITGSIVSWIVFGVMAIFVIFATTSPYFNVKKISIQRDEAFVNIEKVKEVLQEFYGRNLLFVNDAEIKNLLKESFPDFREIEITENWPDELELKIKISPALFNVFNTETANFSVISEDGVVLESQGDEALPVLKIFQHKKILPLRKNFLEKEILEKILLAQQLLIKDIKLQQEALHYLYSANELHFIFRNNSAIWIDLSQNIESQIKKLDIASEKIGLYRRTFDHIDIRIPNQIFWK